MHPAPIKSSERCKTLSIWPSLSEMKHRKEKREKKRADFTRGYTATETEVKLRNPDYHMLLATFTVGN